MRIDIYIRERNGNREIRVPLLPEEIECESGGITTIKYDIMNKGEVVVPTGTGLSSYSWSSEFPGKYRTDKSMQRGTWKQPKHYHDILESWRKNGTPLKIMVTGYPINKDVILEDYSYKVAGAFGDLEYEVKFIEDRDITITSQKQAKAKTTKRSTKTKKTTTHTIKKGDTLWAISKKYLGAGSKWRTIYNANKAIIEKTAKKHGKKSSSNGHWIYPGTKLTIPK